MWENWRSGCQFRYLGIDIGQIQTLDLITARNEVQAKAVLYPNMSRPLLAVVRASQWSHRKFRQLALSILILSSSRISTSNRCRGNPRRDFELQEATITDFDSCYPGWPSIIVEAPEAGSLGIGTPVLFRGLEVGTVTGRRCNTSSDRVMIAMRISKRYQHRA